MLNRTDAFMAQDVVIRSYRAADFNDANRLYRTGLLLGHLDPADYADDLMNIQRSYLSRPGSHFWVAECRNEIVGTIAVTEDESLVARIRRLRVDPAWRSSALPARLLQTAVEHCRDYGYLKVVLDTHLEPSEALRLLDGDGFLHARSRDLNGKHVLEFYVDLYRRPRRTHDEDPEPSPWRRTGDDVFQPLKQEL